jgi:hypothetical protein
VSGSERAVVRDTVSAVIANGGSLSAGVDLRGYILCGISMPAAWTAADLSFQVAPSAAGTYQDVYALSASLDTEYVVQAAAGRFIPVTDGAFDGVEFLKVRSGLTAAAVIQGAERTIVLHLRKGD